MYISKSLWFAAIHLAWYASACESCDNMNKLERRQEATDFSYLGLTGPVDWIQFEGTCGTGKAQSPINVLSTMKVSSLGDSGEYPDIGATGYNFTNTGRTVEVFYKGPRATLAGVDYELQRFHFHTPSEHRLDDEWFPMELHFVHASVADPKKLAVVGIFIDTNEENKSDPLMSRLATLLSSIENKGDTTIATYVPLGGARTAITNAKKFTYSGSLTTPPCTEGVTWYVSNTILDISVADYKAFKRVLGYNSRNLQADPGKQNIVEFAAQFVSGSQQKPSTYNKQRRSIFGKRFAA